MIIGLVGYKGSGKDTIANVLCDHHHFRNLKFAQPLKDMFRTFLRFRDVDEFSIERMIEGDLKETPFDVLFGHTPRHFMTTLGDEWGRQLIHPDIWVQTVVAEAQKQNSVFSDVRYPNEVSNIKQAGGVVVRINRKDLVPDKSHVSEQHIDTLVVDHDMYNDFTSADELRKYARDNFLIDYGV